MNLPPQDVAPISEARTRLTEFADDVVSGAEKLLTEAEAGLHEVLAGQRVSNSDLMKALS